MRKSNPDGFQPARFSDGSGLSTIANKWLPAHVFEVRLVDYAQIAGRIAINQLNFDRFEP